MWYVINGELYHADDKVLMHYGVKGMKWGRRKALQVGLSNGRRGGKNSVSSNDTDAKQARKQKIKKAVKIGAAVAATALAAYGAKKFHDVVRDKNLSQHIAKGREISKNLINPLLSSNDYYREMARDKARNPLKPGHFTDYDAAIRKNERLVSDIIKNELDKSYARAKRDSFGTALKNVVKDEMAKRRR